LIGEPLFQFWELASSHLKAASLQSLPYLKPLGSTLLGPRGALVRDLQILLHDHSRISAFAGLRWSRLLPRFYISRVRAAATNSCNWRRDDTKLCRKRDRVSLLQALLAGIDYGGRGPVRT